MAPLLARWLARGSTQVLNREWEYGHRRGFRCVFDRGILQLFVNFKMMRYRR